MASTRRHRLLALLAAVALVGGLAGCVESTQSSGKGKHGVSLVTDGNLTACTSLPYKPYEFSKGDKIVGFDIDLLGLVAKDLGVKKKVIDTPWGGIVSGEDFNTGKCDVAAGGATITKQRDKVVDFSHPYFDVKQSLLVKKGSGIAGLGDLKGKKLGAQLDTTGKLYAKKNQKKYGYTIVDFEDFALLTAAVSTGKVDASIADSGILKYYVKHHPGTAVGAEYDTGDKLGLIAPEDEKATLDEVNKVLDKAKKDGTYAKLYKKWFGEAPPK